MGCIRNDGCGTLRSRLLDFLIRHKVSARAHRCETPRDSFEISLPISFAFCLKRKSARETRAAFVLLANSPTVMGENISLSGIVTERTSALSFSFSRCTSFEYKSTLVTQF